MDLFTTYQNLTVGVFGTLCVAIGYLYKAQRSKKENIKSALYLLLEIWHRMTIFAKIDFEQELESFISEICKKFPKFIMSDKEKTTIKKQFSPILINMLHQIAIEGYNSLEDAFKEAVSNISKDDPVLAYKINNSSNIKGTINHIDRYLQESIKTFGGSQGQLENLFSKKIQEMVSIDLLKNLERDVILLSRRLSLVSEFKVRRLIRKRKKKIAQTDLSEMNKWINEIIPMIVEFNNQMQPTTKP